MSMRRDIAQAASALSTWALKDVLHRPAANFPGKVGLYVDPRLIADLKPRLREGSVVVVGTNGKTTVTNMLADAFEAHGKTVACNRTGANLDSGIATALLHTDEADWGILECDELWLPKVTPQLQPSYVVLLNLFRDQLDRAGEIDHVQDAIARALAASPETTLIFNADDPLCQAIADKAANVCIPFGIDEKLGIEQNTVADASICQTCNSPIVYDWRQYGQLGSYHCPTCGFRRAGTALAARDVEMTAQGISFSMNYDAEPVRASIPAPAVYLVYNVLAVCAAAASCGVPFACVDEVVRSFAPRNGRLQRYKLGGRSALLNLAKNPTGFNQNLRIIMNEPGPKAVAFFINDKEADGRDVSWLWDVDFQELAGAENLVAYAGGMRRNDMQVRLKYAGVNAALVNGARDFAERARRDAPDADLFLIANYTALPSVKGELDALAEANDDVPAAETPVGALPERPSTVVDGRAERAPTDNPATHTAPGDPATHTAPGNPAAHAAHDDSATDATPGNRETLTIVHLYPELLNLYGDGGNVTILAERARARGFDAKVVRVEHGQPAPLDTADIVFLGGGPDREQQLASLSLLDQAEALRAYVEGDGVLLAICGGYQILGREWLLGGDAVPGLGILDITTKRADGGSHNRLVGNIALESPLASMPVIGYENHAGRTFLGKGCSPFGRVADNNGKGNNDDDGADGALYHNVVGTYLHGPLLSKNPEVADWFIARALERRAAKKGDPSPALAPLDDAEERAANEAMRAKLGLHR